MRIQQIVTTIHCDPCLIEDTETQASDTFTVAIDAGPRQRSKARTIDVCDQHKAQLLELLRITRGGQTRSSDLSAVAGRVVECPLCSISITNRNLADHLVGNRHNLPDIEHPTQCPDCEFVHDRPQAMGIHRLRAHGYSKAEDIVARAIQNPKVKSHA